MFHHIPLDFGLLAFAFAVISRVGRWLVKSIKQVNLQRAAAQPPSAFSAPARSQALSQDPPLTPNLPPSEALPSSPVPPPAQSRQPLTFQAPAFRSKRSEAVRTAPRQPDAGGPAVYQETDRRDFERQEQELEAFEPAALRTSLTSPLPSAATAQRPALFSNTDDLIRAIILQEVLGPPLSRRPSPPPPAQPQ